jgi:hypothetical protein
MFKAIALGLLGFSALSLEIIDLDAPHTYIGN